MASIVAANKLTDPTLHVGQWILIPGAKNKPVPAIPPPPRAQRRIGDEPP